MKTKKKSDKKTTKSKAKTAKKPANKKTQQPTQKAAASKLEKKLGVLPSWNLTDFYPALDDAKVAADIVSLKKQCSAFKVEYAGKVADMDGAALGKALAQYEQINELMGKLGSYAQLLYSVGMINPKVTQFYQNTSELLTDLSSEILFFTLDINKLDDAALKLKMKDKALAHYAPWIRDVRSFKPYQLKDEMEKLLLEKSVTGGNAWIRLFDETITALRFPMGKKMLTEPQVMDLMSNKDGAIRKQAAESVGKVFKENAPIFTLITNTLAKDKEIEDRWRGFKQPISSRNVSNYIEDEVVEALLTAVQQSYSSLSHRYYSMKAEWLGKKQLNYWDRNAPLPFSDDRTYKYEDAKTLVLESFGEFSPTLAKTGKVFFEKNWIDVPVREGKATGAFAHPTVPSVHPYLLLNYQGKSRDVMTLAHELGHGVHQVLAGKQGQLMCDTPLTLAETASVFGEMLTFQRLLATTKDKKSKRALIASKVEDMLNTVVRQTAFCIFEKQLHDARRQGELSTEQIGDIWMNVQRTSLGPALKLDGDYQYFWSYIPHFIHSPFYVYAYAFGDCLVNSLYGAYQDAVKAGKRAEFEAKYIEMLEAGGTLRHKELLAPFGLDATNPKFWLKGLSVISSYIDLLE